MSRQFDAFGNERISRRYPASRPGCAVRTFFPEPGTSVVEDESGRMVLHDTDLAGRLLRVAEDKGSGDGTTWDDTSCAASQNMAVLTSGYRPSTTIAEYFWDAIDRLSLLRANGDPALGSTGPSLSSRQNNEYFYRYDMAGRLRAVDLAASKGSTTSALTRWVTYEYEPGEPFPTSKFEGLPAAGNEVIRWSYDDLGRLTQRLVRPYDYNPMDWPPTDPANWLTFTNTYDTLPSGAEWLGAQLQASSPWETTTYDFGQTFGPHGTVGHAVGSSRVFADGVLAPRVSTSTFSLAGSVLSTTHPSGVVMESEYDAGWLDRHRLVTTAGALIINLDYDEVGLATGWTAGNKSLSLHRAGFPDQLTDADYDIAGTEAKLGWSYGADGRIIQRRHELLGLPSTPSPTLDDDEVLTYDALSRIAGIDVDRTVAGTTDLAGEAFTYDAIGNVKSYDARADHINWTDYEHGFFGLLDYRCGVLDLGGGSTDQLREENYYDTQLRLTNRAEHNAVVLGTGGCGDATAKTLVASHRYRYEGSGQLARYEGSSGTNVDYQYSLDGSLVRRVENDGARVEYYAGSWKLDVRDDGVAREVEQVHPAIQVLTESGGTQHLVWLARDITGNAVLQVDNSGEAIHYGRLGAYGAPLETLIDFAANPFSSAPDASEGIGHLTSFHGVKRDNKASLTTMGVRHLLATGDGRWLQPEPLLLLGGARAGIPRSWLGAYAASNPISRIDTTGYQEVSLEADTVYDHASQRDRDESDAPETPFATSNAIIIGLRGGASPQLAEESANQQIALAQHNAIPPEQVPQYAIGGWALVTLAKAGARGWQAARRMYSRLAKTGAGQAIVESGKWDYLFGRALGAKGSSHNVARSNQNLNQMMRLGLTDDADGRAILQNHFDSVVRDPSSVVRTFVDEYGTFEIRESLFVGPAGFARFTTTWQVMDNGARRLTTLIPQGGR